MPEMPVGLDWAAVTAAAGDFLGSTLVVGALAAVLAVRFIPKFLAAVRAVMR